MNTAQQPLAQQPLLDQQKQNLIQQNMNAMNANNMNANNTNNPMQRETIDINQLKENEKHIIEESHPPSQHCYHFNDYKTGELVENRLIPKPTPKQFTIMGWVKPSELQKNSVILARDEKNVLVNQLRLGVFRNHIELIANGGPYGSQEVVTDVTTNPNVWKSSLTSTKELPINEWSHITVVVDILTCSLYINGMLDKQTVNVTTFDGITNGITHNSNVEFRIGSRYNAKNDPTMCEMFKGELKQFVFFDYVLCVDQIVPFYHLGLLH